MKNEFSFSAISAARRRAFVVLGAGNGPRIVNESRRTQWPLLPHSYCMLGFVFDRKGYSLVYQSSLCSCLQAYQGGGSEFGIECISDQNTYEFKLAEPLLDESSGGFARLTKENAFLFKISDKTPINAPNFVVRRDHIKTGETVYAIGVQSGVWAISTGEVIAISGDGAITTTCEAFHGYCGAQLVDSNGAIVGFGATINYVAGNGQAKVERAYGRSEFENVALLIDKFSRQSPTDFDVEYA